MRERKIDYSMKYSTGSVHALHLSAVHPDIGPGHIARIRTGDHANDMGDLLHPPDAADGNRRQLARGAGLRLLQRYVASAHIQFELALPGFNRRREDHAGAKGIGAGGLGR